MIQTFSVTGMTCQNCVRHVTEALAHLPGVGSVRVDLAGASAEIQTDREVPEPLIARALDEAGYGLG